MVLASNCRLVRMRNRVRSQNNSCEESGTGKNWFLFVLSLCHSIAAACSSIIQGMDNAPSKRHSSTNNTYIQLITMA